jgi:hypothetical protein
MRTRNSDKKDTIVKTKTGLKMIKCDAQSNIKKINRYLWNILKFFVYKKDVVHVHPMNT